VVVVTRKRTRCIAFADLINPLIWRYDMCDSLENIGNLLEEKRIAAANLARLLETCIDLNYPAVFRLQLTLNTRQTAPQKQLAHSGCTLTHVLRTSK
jgi:hypothetical protein